MSTFVVLALVRKDLALFFRDRFFAVITVLGLVFYALVFFLLPATVDETLEIGVHTATPIAALDALDLPGASFEVMASADAVEQAVLDGAVVAGVVLPEGFPPGPVEATLYLQPGTPNETRDALQGLLATLFDALAGQPPAVVLQERIIGTDLAGQQIPTRDRMRPLLAILLIMVETMGLANLISREIARDTIRAVLVTPVTTLEFFTAKGITGTTIALAQALVLMGVIGGISTQPVIVLLALLLGSVMVTGVAFVLATLGRDILTVMVWGVLVLLVFSIPSFSIMFPGLLTGWIQVIPSYYLVQAIDLSMNFGLGFGALWDELAILAGVDIVALGIGVFVLHRRAL